MSLLPIGNYQGEIVSHDLVQLGDKKTPCVVVDVRLSSGVDEDRQSVECDGETKRVIFWLTDKALPYTVKALASVGYTSTRIEGLSLEHEAESGLLGVSVNISCKHTEDLKGIMRERLGMFPIKAQTASMDAKHMTTFGKLFRREQEKLKEAANEDSNTVDDVETEEDAPVLPPKKVAPKTVPPQARTPKTGNTYQDRMPF